MRSELLKRIVLSVERTLSISSAGSVDRCLDKVSVRELVIDAVEHLLMAALLLINLISKVNVVLVVLVHAILITTIEPLIALRLLFILLFAVAVGRFFLFGVIALLVLVFFLFLVFILAILHFLLAEKLLKGGEVEIGAGEGLTEALSLDLASFGEGGLLSFTGLGFGLLVRLLRCGLHHSVKVCALWSDRPQKQ